MQYDIEIDGRVRHVVVHRKSGTFLVTVDGQSHQVDAVPVDAQSWSLLVGGGSHEVAIARNPTGETIVSVGGMPVTALNLFNGGRRRSGRKEDGAHGGPWPGATSGGPHRIVAPMPGKVVRVLAERGAAVKARQPIVVIEAMKMENELRAGRDGIVAEVHVREGQSVEAGVLLVVVTAGAE